MAHPDQRHLRRAADAVAGEDSNQDRVVAVQLNRTAPFDAFVFDPSKVDVDTEVGKLNQDFEWAKIPARAEQSALNPEVRDSLYFVVHDWWSPLVVLQSKVKRARVAKLRIVAEDDEGNVLVNVDLTEELRTRARDTDAKHTQAFRPRDDSAEPPSSRPDAVFFSFEALDKFLFPQLVSTYGVTGAWTMRNDIRQQIGEQL